MVDEKQLLELYDHATNEKHSSLIADMTKGGHASIGRNDMLNTCLRTLTGWGGSAVTLRAGAMRRLELGATVTMTL